MRSLKLKKLLVKAILVSVITISSTHVAGITPLSVYAAQMSGTVTVKTSSLWTYNKADWSARAQVVNYGAAFSISEKLTIEGRDMYGLTNGLYITANPAYVSAQEVAPASAATYKATTASVNMRTGPSTTYSVMTTLPRGAVVQVLEHSNGWDKVVYNGSTGWMAALYLTATSQSAPAPAPTKSYKTVTVNLNMRTGPSTSYGVVTTIPTGAVVEVFEHSNGWDKIAYNGTTGWVAALYLTTGSLPAAPVANVYKAAQFNLNMRSGPSTSYDRITTIPVGGRLQVIDHSNGWDKVIYNGTTGWAAAEFLTTVNETATGAEVIDFAETLLGIPYTWGGNTPEEGFDCSGFTKYVYANFGITIPRTSGTQATFGTAVPISAMQPGDIMYFGNNGSVGHVGLYYGNNQMIHSPVPGRSVEIKDLTWYLSNYEILGARRVLK